jgi:hypothetical protein
LEGIITGVSVGLILVFVNNLISAYKNKKSSDKAAIQLLLKCNLIQLCALKKSGMVNGDCDEALDELNEFLIKK